MLPNPTGFAHPLPTMQPKENSDFRPIIRGVVWHEAKTVFDSRGALSVLDDTTSLFAVRRWFWIHQCSGADRAEHAISCHEVLIAQHGSLTVELNNGLESATCSLTQPQQVLFIHAGVWIRLRDLCDETVLFVGASRLYEDTEYFDGPRPTLCCNAKEPWQ